MCRLTCCIPESRSNPWEGVRFQTIDAFPLCVWNVSLSGLFHLNKEWEVSMDISKEERGAHDAKGQAGGYGAKDAKGKAVGYSTRDLTEPATGGQGVQHSPSQDEDAA